MQAVPKALAAWRAVARSRDPAGLDALLSDEVVFESPVVHTPQRGKAITTKYLAAALKVLGGEFRYVEEWINPRSAVLEFAATIDGIAVNGVDIIGWDADDRIVRFKVMVRPLKGMEALRAKMAAELGFPAPAGPPQSR
jgi:hypothetical protein